MGIVGEGGIALREIRAPLILTKICPLLATILIPMYHRDMAKPDYEKHVFESVGFLVIIFAQRGK